MFLHNVQTRRRLPGLISSFSFSTFLALTLLVQETAMATVNEPGIETLTAEIRVMKERIDCLERQLNNVMQLIGENSNRISSATEGKQPSVQATGHAGTAREYVYVTATDTSAISVGGRVKLDAIYNSRSVGGNSGANSGDLAFFPSTIPVNGAGEDDQFSFNARQTRLWLKGYSPGGYGEMAGYIEIDFNSSSSASNEKVSNSYIPRLRHAYGMLGGFTLGQTYTTFMNVSAYPEINDLNGPVGIMNIRQPLFRYGMERDWGNFYLALENPETTLVTADATRIAADDERLPDIVGKLEFTGDWGNWTLSGMAREIRSDSALAANIEDSAWGGAVSAAGRIRLHNHDNLRFNLSYGNALGRYLSFNGFDDGMIDNLGKIRLNEIIGGYLAYQHWWRDDLRSSISAGFAHADNSPLVDASGVNHLFYSTHLNLIWSPSLNASIGIEWLHGYRELEDGRDGRIDRVQLTSIYNF